MTSADVVVAGSQEKPTIPRALERGDLIAFISPSNRLNTLFASRITRAISFFQSHGFRVAEIITPLSSDHLSSLHQRCEEVHSAFRNPDVKAIICTIGGISANELLPHLDYELIKAHPKIFVGYSDISILHCAFLTQAGLRSFYGPAVIPQFGEFPVPQHFTIEHFFGTLMEGKGKTRTVVQRSERYLPRWIDWMSEQASTQRRESLPSPRWKWLRAGKAKGCLVGGCLPSLVQICGTKYLPDPHGKILLLETPEGMSAPDAPFPPAFARSAMADLRNAGVLDKISGMVVGRPFQYTEAMIDEFEKMIVDVCYATEFPILVNVDVGHVDPLLTLPLGCLVSLDSERDEFVLEESAVC